MSLKLLIQPCQESCCNTSTPKIYKNLLRDNPNSSKFLNSQKPYYTKNLHTLVSVLHIRVVSYTQLYFNVKKMTKISNNKPHLFDNDNIL